MSCQAPAIYLKRWIDTMIISLASDTNKQPFAAGSETVSAFQKFC